MIFNEEIPVDGVHVLVDVYYEPGEAAYMSGHPDNWHPGSGADVDIRSAEVVDIDELIDYIYDEIEEDGDFDITVGPFSVRGHKRGTVLHDLECYAVGVSEDLIERYLEENSFFDEPDYYEDW